MRTRRLRPHRRLAFQMGVAVAVVSSMSFVALGWILVTHQRDTLTRELTLRVLAETRSLALAASAPLLRRDPELGLHPLILRALERNKDLEDVTVLDENGVIVGHKDLLRVNQQLRVIPGPRLLPVPPEGGARAWLEQDSIVITQDIVHLDDRAGVLVARVGRGGIHAAIRQSLQRSISIAGVGLVLVMLLILAMVNRALRPLGELREGMQSIGAGDLATRVHVDTSNELGMLAELINDMAEGLQSAQSELIQKERLDHELAIARDLQSTLLPNNVQAPNGYEVAAHYTPALEVSGDYYDIIQLGDDRIGLLAADVSGKGVPGLVVMAMLRVVLRGLASGDRRPMDVLASSQRMLKGTMRKGMFVTCLYGVLDARSHRFDYASAGHCPPLLYGANQSRWLDAGGKPIGLFPSRVFESSLCEQQVVLQPDECLLLYTDGLVEAMNIKGDQLGEDPVAQLLAGHGADPPSQSIDRLRKCVKKHRGDRLPTDDLTLVVLRRLQLQHLQRETPVRPG